MSHTAVASKGRVSTDSPLILSAPRPLFVPPFIRTNSADTVAVLLQGWWSSASFSLSYHPLTLLFVPPASVTELGLALLGTAASATEMRCIRVNSSTGMSRVSAIRGARDSPSTSLECAFDPDDFADIQCERGKRVAPRRALDATDKANYGTRYGILVYFGIDASLSPTFSQSNLVRPHGINYIAVSSQE